MEVRRQHIKSVIKEKVLNNQDPYMKCFIITNTDCPGTTAYDDGQIRAVVQDACDSLMDELGFRFKIEFQPECCFLRARKIPDVKDEFQKLKEKYNYARSGQSI
jgi:hypothetical protein